MARRRRLILEADSDDDIQSPNASMHAYICEDITRHPTQLEEQQSNRPLSPAETSFEALQKGENSPHLSSAKRAETRAAKQGVKPRRGRVDNNASNRPSARKEGLPRSRMMCLYWKGMRLIRS
ncbi:unnamed protein product [Linum trigynum]|uniref:Uncharacterized protein n=1 Tax=Linum trigynum TaxID=586398 RepID=A0AAV2CVF7_9ROSI